ncbi:NUDIX domain-containing protein [Paenibacillus guangzhouensis]|uniref:NUDIX domain-containing protein n=1 Tax=Paenibacillus guangzhouensis TaxID=1473112 RepID=UPI00187BA9ED|nr:NUDIX domain-containing protein [Paenibacillus guangzhouensis]
MEIRQMSTAFLFNEDKVLLMKKESSKLTNQPFWTGLGGHMESDELNYPIKACFREIYEESGIKATEINELKLRYILIRIKHDEIRQQFVYFGKTIRTQYVTSDEGELYWKDIEELKELHTSKIIEFMLEHYQNNINKTEIMIGTITIDQDENPKMQWSELKDPIIF